MPRKVGAGGHAPIRPPQEPPPPTVAPPPAAAHASSSSSSSAGPSRRAAGSANARRLTAGQRIEDTREADKYNKKFIVYFKQLQKLDTAFLSLEQEAKKQFEKDLVRQMPEAPGAAGSAATQARGREKNVVDRYREALAVLKAPLPGAADNCLVDQFYEELEKFDNLQERTRYGIVHSSLDTTVHAAKDLLARVVHDREAAHFAIFELTGSDLRGRYVQLMEEYGAQQATRKNDVRMYDSSKFEPLMTSLAGLTAEMGDLRAEGLANMKTAARMLNRPEVRKIEGLKNDFASFLRATNYNNAGLSFMMAENVEVGLRILVEDIVAGATDKQHSDKLTTWADSVMALCQEYHMVTAVNVELMAKEKSVLRKEHRPTAEEERVWAAAAEDIPERYEQIAASLRRCADTYHTLQPTVNPRLDAVIHQMGTCLDDAASSRRESAQIGAERVRASEAERLPAHMLPRQRQPESERAPRLRQTSEGVVLGRINAQDGLEVMDSRNNVAARYFQDEGEWVRDYGDDVKVAQSTRPAAKADHIAAVSDRSVAKVRKELEGASETEQIRLLNRAYSSKAKAMVDIAGILPDANPGEAATLNNLLKKLLVEKKALKRELQQVQDSRMMRQDPKPAAFLHLWDNGRVESIEQTKQRQASLSDASDFLDRYVITFKNGPDKERFKRWVVHAHYDTAEKRAEPQRVHMKRFDEKDWGRDSGAYHSAPLNAETFGVIRREIVRQMVDKMRAAQA